MSVTILDGIVVVVILFSSFLAMLRGFSREALSFISWIIAAVSTFYSFKLILPFTEQYLSNKMIALVITFFMIFITVLVITSIITMKIADFIIDSRIGALDRTVGFIFGAFRGLLIAVISILLINALVKPEQQSDWLKNAQTKPMLDSLSKKIAEMMPKDLDYTFEIIEKFFKKDDTSDN
ncbi:membrane protein required for colicin V production [Bartonella sp. CDC_skunk]|uniref:CvpA family protein n=1 Tax=unclassified Bartonella TaxID=2645622 RepID=UPI00099A8A5D|nr:MULTISPECIES: CvpA family protein [unclassified Bartonella]AQX21555.1 membrane protein required for colicin V production [Bartonella sp. CDC_skunk]AQX26818.1 membrane protein required for colicin V production [Bartonella sp. Raccoon60]